MPDRQREQRSSQYVFRIIRPRVERGLPGGDTTLAEFELHDGLSQCHVFHDLVHGRLVVHRVHPVWIHAHIRRVEHFKKFPIGNPPRKSDVVCYAKFRRERLHILERWTITDDTEVNVVPPVIEHDRVHGVQEEIDTLLLTDHPDIADEMRATFP